MFSRSTNEPHCESHCGSKYTSYNSGMSTSDDGPRTRPIPIEDVEINAPGDSRPGDQTDKPVAKRPWWFIGRRFVEGIPFTKTKRP
jgi:hypothetical protein